MVTVIFKCREGMYIQVALESLQLPFTDSEMYGLNYYFSKYCDY